MRLAGELVLSVCTFTAAVVFAGLAIGGEYDPTSSYCKFQAQQFDGVYADHPRALALTPDGQDCALCAAGTATYCKDVSEDLGAATLSACNEQAKRHGHDEACKIVKCVGC